MVWYSHLFKNFPQFIVIHTVKRTGIVREIERVVFLELSCFFNDPIDVGNLISGSSAFLKASLNIWKFTVHILLKPGLDNFENYFTRVWDECDCAVVWAFFASSGNLMLGLVANTSKRAYAIPRSTAPRAFASAAVHCWPVPPHETLRNSSSSVSVESLGPGAHKVCLNPPSISGMILNFILPFLQSCWGFSITLVHGVAFFGGIQHSPVYGCSAASCNFGVLTGEAECKSFYSSILGIPPKVGS